MIYKGQIDLDIYNKIVYVFAGDSWDEIQTHLENEFGITSDLPKEADGLSVSNFSSGNTIICLLLKRGKSFPFETLSHEALHSSIDILHHIGHTPTREDQEPLAYLMSHLIEKILNLFIEWKVVSIPKVKIKKGSDIIQEKESGV